MANNLKRKYLGLPINIWIAQLLYVIYSLILLVVLITSLNLNSVPFADARLFVIVYVFLMVIVNIFWRLTIFKKHAAIITTTLIFAIILDVGIAQLLILQSVHSSFDNYYKFRGCSELISKSTDSGVCKLPSGKTIKIVKFENKWYLDGDLPNGPFSL